MKTCAVCHQPLKPLHSFRFQEGSLCPECYRKASLFYKQTITDLSFDEVVANIVKAGQTPDGFEISEKIGPFLAVDRKHHQFAILKGGKFQEEFSTVHAYPADEIVDCQVKGDPAAEMSALSVQVKMKDHSDLSIDLAKKPIRTSSFAFRQSYHLARRMKDCLDKEKIANR
ncbi:DUF4428 domain-containing protein [Allobaculum sp. JKK-2023]|uniref:DUF4428 domain-containing protein n=1 Tax=Allobaculum sp. JKK-2023 TaxID=3108943 RepID=UPI002B05A622|nr:DUF4428 domain-containing protein [Allobaculum sp. JKK-2023]